MVSIFGENNYLGPTLNLTIDLIPQDGANHFN